MAAKELKMVMTVLVEEPDDQPLQESEAQVEAGAQHDHAHLHSQCSVNK
jgi:hypothetical protein